ncbi:MAG: enoyl-CoA hydratase/isomerase family protein [Thermodesulfobacteriota bacterium]
MNDTAVLYRREANVGIITMNRPRRLNAINLELLRGIMAHLEEAREDTSVKTVILTGGGGAFCAGEDLKETAGGKGLEQWIEETERLQNIQRMIMKIGKPVIAAVSGYALGGGCEFAMGCDLRIADESARFGFPETGVGLTVTNAGTKLLTHLVGLGKAKELILCGDFIDAREAERIGLVNKVVAPEELMPEAVALAEKMGKRSPLALRLSRIAIDQGMETSFDQTLELELSHLLICAQQDQTYVRRRLEEMSKAGASAKKPV